MDVFPHGVPFLVRQPFSLIIFAAVRYFFSDRNVSNMALTTNASVGEWTNFFSLHSGSFEMGTQAKPN